MQRNVLTTRLAKKQTDVVDAETDTDEAVVVAAADVPDWLSELQPTEVEAASEPDEDDLLAWLDDIQPEAETTTCNKRAAVRNVLDLAGYAEIEAAVPAEETSLDWEALAEELTEGGLETPETEIFEAVPPTAKATCYLATTRYRGSKA